MSDKEADIKSDKISAETPPDDHESIGLMEPMLITGSSRHRANLTDLAVELTAKSAGFKRSLPNGIRDSLSKLIRSMNCYYSNLIEGHDTHPIDIERALNNDYSADTTKRNLQLEAKAHIEVQKWIDEGGLNGKRATSKDGICELHMRFGEGLPDDLLWAENPETGERIRMKPGALRTSYVRVGNHIAISPGAISRFLDRYEAVYGSLGRSETIVAAAAAHHRLAWIHPFVDGNGRVARLMSYAMLRDTLDTGGIWSIARGLARNVEDYKSHLAACDADRRNDLDGRGQLSEEALAEFTKFFLETCIDQVNFMEELVQPSRLRNRMLIWAEEEIRADALPAKSGQIIEAVLYRGELPRGEISELLGVGDRQARRVTAALIDAGVITSESSRAPLRLTFPAKLASRWMPGLFPDAA